MKAFLKVSKKAGLPPGTPVHVGERKAESVKMTVLDYTDTQCEFREVKQVEECFPYKDKTSTTWINIDGLHDVSLIEKIGVHFGIHPLIIEDILNTGQRPKIDIFEDYLFVVLKMHSYNSAARNIDTEQISLVLGKYFVLSFQEREGDIFEPLRARIINAKGRVRKAGSDYLLHSIIDSVVDNYFKVLEGIGEEIEDVEDSLIENPVPDTVKKIHSLKSESLFLRKSVWPLREVISTLEREESPLIKKATRIYMRDLYDHTIQVIDTVETYRDIIAGMLDVYLSSVSNRMNEIMKVLTIYAVIFIPLTFIAGIYGMNFNTEKSPFNMPELSWYFGYPFALGLMALIGISMLVYFRRKKWL